MARFPIAANSDGIANESGVAGDSVSDALDTLSASGGGNLQDGYDAAPTSPQLQIDPGQAFAVKNATGDPAGFILGVTDVAGTAEHFAVTRDGVARDAAYTGKGVIRAGAATAGQMAMLPAGADGDIIVFDSTTATGLKTETPSGGGGVTAKALLGSLWPAIGIAQVGSSTTSLSARGYALGAAYVDASSILTQKSGVPVLRQKPGGSVGNQCTVLGHASLICADRPVFFRRFWASLFPGAEHKEAMGFSVNMADLGTFPSSTGSEEYSLKYSNTDFGNNNLWLVIVSNSGATTQTFDTGILVESSGTWYGCIIYMPTATSVYAAVLDIDGAVVYEKEETGLTTGGLNFRPAVVGETELDFGYLHHLSWGFGTLMGGAG